VHEAGGLGADEDADAGIGRSLGLYPASSRLFQLSWRIKRWCGLMDSASQGEMLKKRGSKQARSVRIPPHLQ